MKSPGGGSSDAARLLANRFSYAPRLSSQRFFLLGSPAVAAPALVHLPDPHVPLQTALLFAFFSGWYHFSARYSAPHLNPVEYHSSSVPLAALAEHPVFSVLIPNALKSLRCPNLVE